MRLLNPKTLRRWPLADRRETAGRRRLLIPVVIVLVALTGKVLAGGTLVIVGGGLESDNRAVYEAVVGALPAAGAVVIVPAASGSPAWSAHNFSDELQRYGIGPERIDTFPLAVRDDESTADVDESGWRDNAWDAGFLPVGLVDQHFGRRAPLGRLVRALAESGESYGYGVGEDTAVVVDLESRQATVLGSGGVTLLDATRAEFDLDSRQLAQGLRIGYAARGPLSARTCKKV